MLVKPIVDFNSSLFPKKNILSLRFYNLKFFVFLKDSLFFSQNIFGFTCNQNILIYDFFFFFVIKILGRFGFCNLNFITLKKK